MRITNVEVIPIYPRLAERYESRKVDLYGIDHRTIFKVHTDNGLVGYGDIRGRPGGNRVHRVFASTGTGENASRRPADHRT